MSNISVGFCSVHGVFNLQFGSGSVYLCSHQLLGLLMNIYKSEQAIFQQALIFSINESLYQKNFSGKRSFQLDFGMLLVRLNREELLFFLILLWKDFAEIMQSVLIYSDSNSEQMAHSLS
ncbi:MAG: hypothetical protein CMK59_14860 [Proteobacteria bacterium]|nr:hypothetical protein [Pseudomonadota bacterium]